MNTRHYYLRLLRTFALATLTAAAVAACSDDNDTDREPLTPPDGADGIPVAFTANINPGSDAAPAGAPGTRTILTPDGGGFTVTWRGKGNPNGIDPIFIWAAKENTLENNGYSKIYVPTTSAASSELMPIDDANKLTLSSSGDWTFTAIYGVSSSEIGGGNVSISPLMQSAPGKTYHIASRDFSVATTTKHVETGDMPDIGLQFKHKLSALQLHVTNQTGEALTVREIRFAVTGDKITIYKKYDVATGDWKAEGEEKSDYLKLIADNFPALATGGASQDLYMLFFPEPEHSGTNMTITVITDRGEFTLTKKAPASPGFQAGTNYMTDITIKTSGLTAEEKWVEYISNKAELIAFRNKVNNYNNYSGKTVRLTADIDLSGEAWTPIGTNGSIYFKGTFDGGGYHISKLSVDNGSKAYAGLFGFVYNGTVRNLRVSGSVTTTGINAGGIAGYLAGSTVENCIFDGEVSGNGSVGGIAGNSEGSRIAGCHTQGSVTATREFVGGIAGQNDGDIDDCYSKAEVTVDIQYAGGIVGANLIGGTITHCYATGAISAKEQVGGIVGHNEGGTVTACIALNPGLTGTSGSLTGRIVGYNEGSRTITSCAAYDGMTLPYGVTVTSAADGIHGTDLTREQCVTATTYTDREFTTANGWVLDNGATWTYLPWNKAFESFHNISETDYRISVPDHLKGTGTVN